MAQDFERAVAYDSAGDVDIAADTARTIFTSDSDDAIVGIRLANVHASDAITADVFITSTASGGSDDSYIIKNANIPYGSSLELIDGGAKIILQSGDVLKVSCDTASALNVWVSYVDAISS
jgi:hypothetical protein